MNSCADADRGEAHALKCELAREVLCSSGKLKLCVTGWSMLPAVWPGDTLLVECVRPNDIKVGDIALVGRDQRLCAHRVVLLPERSGNRFWTTQGDAMPRPDRPVIESELLGRVTKLIRSGKCMAVPASLSVVERLLAQFVRRSAFAARVFVYLTRRVRTQRESIRPCRG